MPPLIESDDFDATAGMRRAEGFGRNIGDNNFLSSLRQYSDGARRTSTELLGLPQGHNPLSERIVALCCAPRTFLPRGKRHGTTPGMKANDLQLAFGFLLPSR